MRRRTLVFPRTPKFDSGSCKNRRSGRIPLYDATVTDGKIYREESTLKFEKISEGEVRVLMWVGIELKGLAGRALERLLTANPLSRLVLKWEIGRELNGLKDSLRNLLGGLLTPVENVPPELWPWIRKEDGSMLEDDEVEEIFGKKPEAIPMPDPPILLQERKIGENHHRLELGRPFVCMPSILTITAMSEEIIKVSNSPVFQSFSPY